MVKTLGDSSLDYGALLATVFSITWIFRTRS
jgi:hypothetical protein